MSEKKYPIDKEKLSLEGQLIYNIIEQWGNVIAMPKMEGWIREYGDGRVRASQIATLPADDAVQNWFEENIDKECSASSAVYKFRQWLESLQAKIDSPAEQSLITEQDAFNLMNLPQDTSPKRMPLPVRDPFDQATEQPGREVDAERGIVIRKMVDFIRDCAANWDCDTDGHKYNTGCRKCDADKINNEWNDQQKEVKP